MKKRIAVWLAAAGVGTLAWHCPGAIVLEGIKAIQQIESATGVRPVTPKPADDAPDKNAAGDPAYSDALRLLNGDLLRGNLAGIDPQRGVRWRTPDARSEIEFKPERVARIVLPKRSAAPTNSPLASLVTLSNGDELLGVMSALDSERLVLDTDYAGPLTIPRKRVAGLRMVKAGSTAIYEGPTSMEGWRTRNTRNNWRYQDGSLIATGNGSIGRDLKLPPMARIEFDLSWRGQLQFLFGMYTDSTEEYGNNSYLLQMQPGYIYLQRMRRNSGANHMGQAEYPGLHQKSRVRVEVLINKEARTIALLLDGTLVKQWKDNLDWGGSGTGVVFGNQNVGMMRITNLRVTEWDGSIQEQNSTTTKTRQDIVELSNKDKISGTLQNIKDGKMNFVTAFANMEIPLERIHAIDFASENLEVAEKKPTDVRAVFAERGALTFTLERWDGQQVLANSSNFGQARFKAVAFNQFYFNWEQQQQEAKKNPTMMFGNDDGEVDE